jgi:cobalt/nickel transport system permease protein
MASVLNPSSQLDIPAAAPKVARRGPLLDGIDPRTRILAAVLFSCVVAISGSLLTLSVALGLGVAGVCVAGAGTRGNLKRLVPVNALVLVLFVLLTLQSYMRGPFEANPNSSVPVAGGETSLAMVGPLPAVEDGRRLALVIGLKANAIVLSVVVLLAGLDSVTLGHALGHLKMPQKLIHLLLFTVRYLDVLDREFVRLRAAMKVRGFRPRVNWHTYRTIGHLIGMLLVRSLDRSERVIAAMKCRGFRGRFYLLDHFAFSARDIAFTALVLASVSLLAALECL